MSLPMAQVIRLQRPKCFCGHVAAAIYPKQALNRGHHRQSPSSSSQGQSSSSQGRRNLSSSSASAASTPALTTNWVYECHFTPKQEGMIDPDHCHGCAHDQIEAKEEEARLAKLGRIERSSSDIWGESRSYPIEDPPSHNAVTEDLYLPNHGHRENGHQSNGYQSNGYQSNGYQSNGYQSNGHSGNGHMNGHPSNGHLENGYPGNSYLGSDPNPPRKSTGSAGSSVWGDEPNDDRTKGKAVDREGRSPHALHAGSSPTVRTVHAAGSQILSLEVAFSTAKPRHPNAILPNAWKPVEVTHTPPILKPSVSQPHTLPSVSIAATAAAHAPAAVFSQQTPFSQQTRSSSPEQEVRWSEDVKVCGFHMHALEWHAMQDRDLQDIIITTQRAQCPVFNLSVTRKFRCELNAMTKQPFNTMECDCGEPMIVSSDLGVRNLLPHGQHYALVCPIAFPRRRNVNGNNVRPMDTKKDRWHGSEHHHRELSNERKAVKGPYDRRPCGKIIPLDKVTYAPRTEPIHTSVRNDEWLDLWFQPERSRESYFRKKRPTEPKARKSILIKKQDRYPVDYSESAHPNRTLVPGKVTFNKKVQVHLPRPDDSDSRDPYGTTTSSTLHHQSRSPGWGLPPWSSPQIPDAILKDRIELWSDPCLSRLKLFNVAIIPKSLLKFTVEEAFQDAIMYAESRGALWEEQNKAQRKRLEEAQSELEDEQHRHATLVGDIEVMRERGQEMTQVKCKICFERTLTHAVLPCFHLVMCGECSQQVRECIVCRTRIEGLQHIRWG